MVAKDRVDSFSELTFCNSGDEAKQLSCIRTVSFSQPLLSIIFIFIKYILSPTPLLFLLSGTQCSSLIKKELRSSVCTFSQCLPSFDLCYQRATAARSTPPPSFKGRLSPPRDLVTARIRTHGQQILEKNSVYFFPFCNIS